MAANNDIDDNYVRAAEVEPDGGGDGSYTPNNLKQQGSNSIGNPAAEDVGEGGGDAEIQSQRDRTIRVVSQLSDSLYDEYGGVAELHYDRDDANSRIISEVYVLIMQGESEKLERHLEKTSERFDVTKILNPSGFTPIHLAAYKG